MNHSPLQLLALSQRPTPVLRLEEIDSNGSDPEPRILFSPDLPSASWNPIELFQSRLYESFEVEKEERESLEVAEWGRDWLINSQLLGRRGSVEFFSEQLGQLKRNVDRLLAITGDRNPEQPQQDEKSLHAKSTESQQFKDQSLQLARSIAAFESPARGLSSISDCSPIAPRSPMLPSNVSETSTRSLMRRKMRLSAQDILAE